MMAPTCNSNTCKADAKGLYVQLRCISDISVAVKNTMIKAIYRRWIYLGLWFQKVKGMRARVRREMN